MEETKVVMSMGAGGEPIEEEVVEEKPSLLANVVYVFCPGYPTGFKFYDQTPRGKVAELAGSIPEGRFWSSGEEPAEWDEKINGQRDDSVKADKETSIVVNVAKEEKIGAAPYNVYTIVVCEEVFLDLLRQIDNPKMHSPTEGRNYKVLDFNTKIRNHFYDNKMDDQMANYMPEEEDNNINKLL